MFSKYKYVYQVYKDRSFTKAAENLFIAQPSLSTAIKNIEGKVGTELFERTGSGVNLTQAGEAYITAAEKILALENELNQKLNDIQNLECGEISVGGSNYMSSYVLPIIINKFKAAHPKINVTLVEAHTSDLLDFVKNDKVDVIVDSFNDTDDYVAHPLVRERIFLCVNKQSSSNQGLEEYQILPEEIHNGKAIPDKTKPVPINKFKKEKFVILKQGNDMYQRATALFKRYKINPDIEFKVDQLSISYALTDSGVGASFITDTFIKHANFKDNVYLYNLDERFCYRPLCIAHKKNKYISRAIAEFIQTATETIR